MSVLDWAYVAFMVSAAVWGLNTTLIQRGLVRAVQQNDVGVRSIAEALIRFADGGIDEDPARPLRAHACAPDRAEEE